MRHLLLGTGISVPCLIHGDAEAKPLLLLHAWGESRHSFERMLPFLDTFRVYAPDLRGQGDADKPEDGYSLAEQAKDAAAILTALTVRSAFVLGSSSGGYVAQQLAIMRPDLVGALVLVGSPVTLQGRAPFAAEVEALTDPVAEEWVQDSLSWFPLVQEVPKWYPQDRVSDGASMPAHAWKRILAGFSDATPPTEAGVISAPTLILWGARDNLLPRWQQDALVERIHGAVLTVYAEAAHLVLWECPAQVAMDATTFLLSLG